MPHNGSKISQIQLSLITELVEESIKITKLSLRDKLLMMLMVDLILLIAYNKAEPSMIGNHG